MIVVRKKPFWIGAGLLASFAILFYFLLTPIVDAGDGQKLTGLQFADQTFNELSKGSSWFIPEARATAKSMAGKNVSLGMIIKPEKLLPTAQALLESCGVTNVDVTGVRLSFYGDLGLILEAVVNDSEALYKNEGRELEAAYGLSIAEIAQGWWALLSPAIHELEKQKRIADARAVETVLRRALEPGNNFYGITAKRVADNIPLVAGFLLFYIVYTVWYGFGVYELFVGLGLMNAEARKEELLCDAND